MSVLVLEETIDLLLEKEWSSESRLYRFFFTTTSAGNLTKLEDQDRRAYTMGTQVDPFELTIAKGGFEKITAIQTLNATVISTAATHSTLAECSQWLDDGKARQRPPGY